MQMKVKLSGNITNDPTVQLVGARNTALMELNVAVNHDRKNKDTGEYEKTGDTTWVLVKLWGDTAENAKDEAQYQKGDLINFEGTLVEKHYKLSNGTEGRKLESDWIETLTVLYRKGGSSVEAGGSGGFAPDNVAPGF
jgi:single-stranded DNA-binding protein